MRFQPAFAMSPSVTGIGTFKSSVLEVSRSMGVECLVVPQGAQMGLGDAGRGRVQILKFFQFNSIRTTATAWP